ncbi:hypothetical protein [Pleomorphovibrio marinus]|uniref:hypothetical protein n=1 Tax=Pleomorphovibrio marinus TaxID=2164132 RepID=UPI000E0A8F8B|nr:hypothetical protein [Pleomorphovibrio marinus]
MNINTLKERDVASWDSKLVRIYNQFRELLSELNKRELSPNVVESINRDVDEINSTTLTGKDLRDFVKEKETKILNQVEKELQLIPKNYYRNLWLGFGIPIGLSIGMTLGFSLGNISLYAIGIPIGMAIGMLVGSQMDKNALVEGRQLDFEIKH